ncbi:MAG: hypothetical protein KatS3mg111_2064 [Pirellulaceae bacterium]|nr:MAG: hypothetical protein KatS3mg111_2064 [Pirellulaceae bacterium]
MSEARQGGLDALQWGSWSDWFQLIRLPLVFTLIADNIAASVMGAGSLYPLSAWLLVLGASVSAYWGGMILNDVVDVERDRTERPQRPLPSGRVSPVIAGHVGNVLLLLAPVLVLSAVMFHQAKGQWSGAAVGAAVGLAGAVRAYDSRLKPTWLGPILMGACRGLHVLMVGLAMHAVSGATDSKPSSLVVFATGIAVYVCGVTVYARREAGQSARSVLALGMIIEALGLLLIALVPQWVEGARRWYLDPNFHYPLLIGLIGITVVHQGVRGYARPVPRFVQAAVKHALLTLILLDASVVALRCGKWAGAATVALVLPALLSSFRWRTT